MFDSLSQGNVSVPVLPSVSEESATARIAAELPKPPTTVVNLIQKPAFLSSTTANSQMVKMTAARKFNVIFRVTSLVCI